MEQGELVKQTLFHLGKVTYLLDVTPSNPLSQHYLHLFHFVLIKFKDLVAKQHPTDTCRHAAHNTMCVTLMYMYDCACVADGGDILIPRLFPRTASERNWAGPGNKATRICVVEHMYKGT